MMPVHTRGRPRVDLISNRGRVHRSAAQRSRLLTSICVNSDSDSEMQSASNFNFSSSSKKEHKSEVHLLDSDSEEDDDVIFIKETRVSWSAVTDNSLVTKMPTTSGVGVTAQVDFHPGVTYATTSPHSNHSFNRFSVSSMVPTLSKIETETVYSILQSLKRLNPGIALSQYSPQEASVSFTSGGNLFRKLPVEVCSLSTALSYQVLSKEDHASWATK